MQALSEPSNLGSRDPRCIPPKKCHEYIVKTASSEQVSALTIIRF